MQTNLSRVQPSPANGKLPQSGNDSVLGDGVEGYASELKGDRRYVLACLPIDIPNGTQYLSTPEPRHFSTDLVVGLMRKDY